MLRDEIKPSEDIAAQTYGRNKQIERDEIARQMAEFESRAKVTVYASGVSSEFKPIASPENIKNAHANSAGVPRPRKNPPHQKNKGVFEFDNLVCQNPQKSKSGYQNLQHVRDDIYTVLVSHRHLGTFPLAIALEKRDKYREAIGLPKAKDSV